MRSMKKMYATMLTFAMIAGMTADVMPVMSAKVTPVMAEDQMQSAATEETDIAADEVIEPLGEVSKSIGSGMASDPWNIAFDEETEGVITRPEDASGKYDQAQYYHYKLTKDTKLGITLSSPGSTRLDISKKKDFKDVMGFIENSNGKGRSLELLSQDKYSCFRFHFV